MSHASSNVRGKAVPAQLRFLAIYNPSLGQTDETRLDQIVYYYDGTGKPTRKAGKDSSGASKAEENERLRHIGLAQGMVEFGKAFSKGKAVDAIETEKSKIILHELEAGWWILASIDLTRLPKVSKPPGPKDKASDGGNIEYSSREVKPPILLLQDLLRAHAIFLLHHTSSISDLFATTKKPKFTSVLGRYWDQFLSTWNVTLHGNPAVAVYNGIKIAGSGELGMGVGEEDRGSGEREVLEGFVGRIDGLVDLIVSRFGVEPADIDMSKPSNQSKPQPQLAHSEPWLGTGSEPGPNDGAIFLGVGALSRKSLRDVTHWMEDIYSWGPRAYGVKGDQARNRRAHRNGRLSSKALESDSANGHPTKARKTDSRLSAMSISPAVPKDNGSDGDTSTQQAALPVIDEPKHKPSLEILDPQPAIEIESTEDRVHSISSQSPSTSSTQSTKGGTLVDYLKLGYGTHWSLGGGTPTPRDASMSSSTGPGTSPPSGEVAYEGKGNQAEIETNDSTGHYLVGLIGDVDADEPENSASDSAEADTTNPRISLRTINVELDAEHDTLSDENKGPVNGGLSHLNSSNEAIPDPQNRVRKDLKVVVYANKPFLFTLFFDVATTSLADSNVYRSLHYQLAPLQRPLLTSTRRKLPRPNLSTTLGGDVKTPIYDLLWDPKKLTIYSTIPDVPSHSLPLNNLPVWSRLESLNTHMQILNTFAATRKEGSEMEQTCKTSRGYWVVWTRIPDPEATQNQKSKSEESASPDEDDTTPTASPSPNNGHSSEQGPDTKLTLAQASQVLDKADIARDKEIFLVRKSSEPSSANAFSKENSNSPAKLAQGIGVDTKRYIEGLLDMYR
ncbi:hypothetical protein V490_04459 [Pseudogymnoascus sp. VKM F-3557]|nr:hypothetical protein V490_04459 [Pseudogymnoascus sp. VKM F-3557]